MLDCQKCGFTCATSESINRGGKLFCPRCGAEEDYSMLCKVDDKLDKILDRLQIGSRTVRVLAVPNKLLSEVVQVIREAIGCTNNSECYKLLSDWCAEQEAYLNRTKNDT